MVSLSEIEARYNNKDYFEILNLPQQLDQLRTLLGCEPKRTKGFNFASNRILSLIQNSCTCVLLEKQYLDDESLDSYSAFYAKSFKRYERTCIRFHFFKEKISLENLHGLIINSENNLEIKKELFEHLGENNYLGFTVLRSFEPPTLGRTYIKPSLTATDFILCETTNKATLAGVPLKVKASPFMQQDQRVSCCATIALWVASEAMHQRFKHGHYSTSQITELATKYTLSGGRALPTQGLSVEQIDWALMGMGYDPMSYEMGPWNNDVKSSGMAKDLIYTYMESNIPVILFFINEDGVHAITVVGHGFMANKKPKKRLENLSFFCSSEWVPYFIIQDDQEGPYRYLRFENKDPNPFNQLPILINDNPSFDSTSTEANLTAIIVTHPTRIYTSGREIEFIKVDTILQTIKDAFKLHDPPLSFPENIVSHTFLISANEFKESLLEREDMSKDLISLYRNKILPKYLWVSEISTIDYRNQLLTKNAHNILGEILIDPTSSPQEYDFISIHLSGYYFEMSPSDKDYYAPFSEEKPWILINSNQPYLSLIRH